MGLTINSTGQNVLCELNIEKKSPDDIIIALAGNPNVGKSTIFNTLTGLNQHTGNWPGKTVTNAQGRFNYKDRSFILVDMPGTYSLMANSAEEEVARDFICFSQPDTVVVVTDATCLERNLNLVLQILEITPHTVVCVNLLDEAKRKGISIDLNKLSAFLGVPVTGTNARKGKGVKELSEIVYSLSQNKISTSAKAVVYPKIIEDAVKILMPKVHEIVNSKLDCRWVCLKLLDGDITLIDALEKYLNSNIRNNEELAVVLNKSNDYLLKNGIDKEKYRDLMVSSIVKKAESIGKEVVKLKNENYNEFDRKIDRVLTSRVFGFPIMLMLLGFVFWLTITGANVPSEYLSKLLFGLGDKLNFLLINISSPEWLRGILIDGMYKTVAWVVSVMLPPMAIFFPIFTLLEDLGYLPRIAFNLDNYFKKAHAHGKQALTMCMGFGCNAAGVIGCRIIDSPRERLIAIITNNFVPCNGRFPTLIAFITMFFVTGIASGPLKSITSAAILLGVIVFGIMITLLISKLLSVTILKGMPSSFTLELPPYRKPHIGNVIVRSILDRTLFVLGRAICVAAPAGIIIWLLANIVIADMSLLSRIASFLDPFATLIGLDGYILFAFILGFPANEIVIPIIIMSYMSAGSLMDFNNLNILRELFISHGWTLVTAICVMLFSLMHFPCSTTCLTIRKETQSLKWTFISILIPTITGIVVCFAVTNIARLFGLS